MLILPITCCKDVGSLLHDDLYANNRQPKFLAIIEVSVLQGTRDTYLTGTISD